MSGWLQDVRHTLRGWRSRPGFTLVVLATLALGIGANTAIFSVVEASLLAPLPFGEPDRLCMIYSQFPSMGFSKFWVSEPEYLEFSRWNQSFQEVGAYRITSRNVGGAQGNPERVVAAVASASLLHALQPQLVLGRAFLPEEDLPGAAPVVVIGERLWRRAFAGDPALVGKQIEVDGKSATVVGVLAASNRLEDAPIEVWAPLAIDPANLAGRGSHYLYLVGRLRDGVSLEAAQSEAKVLLAHVLADAPPEDT
ncbi:MAG TPA: ABC transporter permease, partial [Thermoanaerobaculia bacterium]|nr:ABC transporter permease [Thermoanaerobaculia bacterium]